jgi:putative transposase
LYARVHEKKMYPSDLSDEEWARLRSHLPTLPKTIRPRAHSLRDILDAIFYVLRSSCLWRLLPHDFPPRPTVYFAERKRVGRDPNPSAAIIDSQSVKIAEESARSNGYDTHKYAKSRKRRHLLVDTLGLPLSVYITPADVQGRSSPFVCWTQPWFVPHLKKIWADRPTVVRNWRGG